jgi:hypothetical protein
MIKNIYFVLKCLVIRLFVCLPVTHCQKEITMKCLSNKRQTLRVMVCLLLHPFQYIRKFVYLSCNLLCYLGLRLYSILVSSKF